MKPRRSLAVLCFFLLLAIEASTQTKVRFEPVVYPLRAEREGHSSEDWYGRHFLLDLNGDHREDLLYVLMENTDLELFIQNADGSFAGGKTILFLGTGLEGTSSETIGEVSPFDWNEDGYTDLSVIVRGKAYLLLNKKDGSFDKVLLIDSSPVSLVSIKIGDLNKDNLPDLLALAGTSAGVFFGRGDGRFISPDSWFSYKKDGRDLYLSAGTLTDLDEDGRLDIVLPGDSAFPGLSFLRGDGTGNFSEPEQLPNDEFYVMHLHSDFDKDEDMDAVAQFRYTSPNGEMDTIYLLLNKGKGIFSPLIRIPFFLNYPFRYSVIDYDRDEYVDATVKLHPSSGMGTRIGIAYGENNRFSNANELYAAKPEALSMQSVDLDKNGWPDVVVVQKDPPQVTVLYNQGMDTTPPRVNPTVVRVPEDYTTLTQALENCIDGDVISLASGSYQDHSFAVTKSISIQGRESNNPPAIASPGWYALNTAVVNIRNVACDLENLQIFGNKCPGVIVENAEIVISGCEIRGSTTARVGGYYDFVLQESQPALVLQNCRNRTFRIQESRLGMGEKGEYEPDQGPAWLIQSCTDILILGHGNQIVGSTGAVYYLRGGRAAFMGGQALSVLDSANIRFQLDEVFFEGGKGADYGGAGGSGGLIDHSSVFIDGGFFQGGKGGDGVVIRNHSQVTLRNTRLEGRPGGEPDGEAGRDVVVDYTSTLTRLDDLPVRAWELH